MSERGPSVLGRIIKWIVVPVLLAAAGVFAVGPYLNRVGVPLPESLKPKAPVHATAQVDATDAPTDQSKYGEPQLEVSVGPGKSHLRTHGRPLRSKSHHRRRRRHKAAPAPAADEGAGAPKGTTDGPQSPPADDQAPG